MITEDKLDRVRGLNRIAEGRGQSLAQMAIAWILREQGKGSPSRPRWSGRPASGSSRTPWPRSTTWISRPDELDGDR